MSTKSLDLNKKEARQLYHGVEFAIKSLRESKQHAVPNILSIQEYNETEQNLLSLQHKMEQFAVSFED